MTVRHQTKDQGGWTADKVSLLTKTKQPESNRLRLNEAWAKMNTDSIFENLRFFLNIMALAPLFHAEVLHKYKIHPKSISRNNNFRNPNKSQIENVGNFALQRIVKSELWKMELGNFATFKC